MEVIYLFSLSLSLPQIKFFLSLLVSKVSRLTTNLPLTLPNTYQYFAHIHSHVLIRSSRLPTAWTSDRPGK